MATSGMWIFGGYPESDEKVKEIVGLEEVENSLVFHAGTKEDNQKVLTNGGRVMALTSFGRTMEEALEKSVDNAKKIHFDGKYFRRDIGFDLKEEKV